MTTSLLVLLGVSFGLGAVLMPLVRAAALHWGLVDHPDAHRKLHRQPIPVSGGIVVFLAACAALVGAFLTASPLRDQLVEQGEGLVGLFLAAGLICALGLVDDFRPLRGRHKLFGQLLAVGIVMSSGVLVEHVHLFSLKFDLGPLAIPFTGLWLLAAINALNLIDGMDGLLGCVGTIICLAMAVLAVATGQWAAAAVACTLAGALLAFLLYNFPPATVFLGDCGSMLVGLVVGVLAIKSSLKAPATVALAAPMALLTIPLFDTFAAVVRRKLTGRSIYTTDRGHIHHCLLGYGLSDRRVLLLVSSLCLLTVAGTMISLAMNNEVVALIAGGAVIGILVVGRLFGYAEFLLLKQRLIGHWVGLHRPAAGHQMEVRLQGSADWTELWADLTRSAAELGLKSLCLDVNAPSVREGYHARWDRFDGAAGTVPTDWRTDIPLMVHGQRVGRLEFAGDRNHLPVCNTIAAASELVHQVEQAISLLVPTPHELSASPAPALQRAELMPQEAGS